MYARLNNLISLTNPKDTYTLKPNKKSLPLIIVETLAKSVSSSSFSITIPYPLDNEYVATPEIRFTAFHKVQQIEVLALYNDILDIHLELKDNYANKPLLDSWLNDLLDTIQREGYTIISSL